MILNRTSLIYITLLAILFVCGVLLLSNTVIDIVRQKEALQNDTERISEDFLRQPSLKEVERNIGKREEDIDGIANKFFAPVTDEFEFAKSLENLANGVIINKVKFDLNKKIEENGYVRVPLEITAESDFPAVLGYIEKLEKINYFFEIDSIEITDLKSEKADASKVEAAIKGSVYWF